MNARSRLPVNGFQFAADRPSRGASKCAVWGAPAAVILATSLTCAASLIATGQPAPAFRLTALDGAAVELGELRGQVVILLFGELYNENSVAAAHDLTATLAEQGVAGIKASAFMIAMQDAPADALRAEAGKKGVTLPILSDEGRRTFAAYRAMVLPSLVVIDPDGRIVLSCAGYPLDFKDLVSDSILVAGGKLSEAALGQRRAAASQPAAPENSVRATRLAALADQLARRGSEELAITNFNNALALDPDCVPARVGLGRCLLSRRELAEAEKQFLHVLGVDPGSVDAALGLISIQMSRGGDELASADKRIRELLKQRPNEARVVYVAGTVAERSGDTEGAFGHYKRAAELLLFGQQKGAQPR